jgi:hypothetical protein
MFAVGYRPGRVEKKLLRLLVSHGEKDDGQICEGTPRENSLSRRCDTNLGGRFSVGLDSVSAMPEM